MFTDKYKTEYNRLLTEILIETMHSILSQLKSSGKNFQVYGCEHPCSLAVYLGLYHSKGPHIIQTDEKDFDEMEQSLLFFNPHLKIHKLFAVDPWFPSQEITKNRLKWLYHAIHASFQDIFLCSSKSLRQKTLPCSHFQKKISRLTPKSPLPSPQELRQLGYKESTQVEEEGHFSQKGGIIDIFSPAHSLPFRLTTVGNTIESIRSFDPKTNRSLKPVSFMDLIPFYEAPFSSEFRLKISKKLKKYKALLDPSNHTHDPQKEINNLNFTDPDNQIDFYLQKLSRGIYFSEIVLFISLFYDQPGQALNFFQTNFQLWVMDDTIKKIPAQTTSFELKKTSNTLSENSPSFNDFLRQELFFKTPEAVPRIEMHSLIHEDKNIWPFRVLKKIKESSFHSLKPRPLFIGAESPHQIQQIKFQLTKENFEVCLISDQERLWEEWREEQLQNPEKVHLITSHLPHHFESIDSIFIKGDLWLGKLHSPHKQPRPFSSHFSKTHAFRFSEIDAGDPVVDKIHGVGLYQGLKTLTFNKKAGEYIELEYKNADRLYIPIHHLYRLFRFKSSLGRRAIDELGQPYWSQKMDKAKKSIQTLVLDLLQLYSKRSQVKRTPFKTPSPDLKQFEKNFPFEETKDQSNTIEQVFKDMARPFPMDRLIIGDSGFGKTEVSMRAVFKAVEDGYQAVFLAPTTILSLQHFKNFQSRFASWPMRIELVNRLIAPSKVKSILSDLEQQKIDILIGSHRLLSSDIRFKKLGLIIIDEEHRFGVRQKEKLKKLKLNVDCIYMSATPIPRTLNMSLSGAKDISLIQTPPKNRIAPKVSVISFQKDKIKTAILREIQRGGQVIFIHNRVQDLNKIYNQLRLWLTDASIGMAHGQMNEKELEKNILDFFKQKYELLLCTTIVETGMDFEKANTIIINDAHKLGLSQLYQLRGRVGRRADIQSYCYFILPEHLSPLSSAVERLNFLQTHNYLNSGYQIARFDLELRGGGEFLGAKQSGHLQNIGYDLYLDLLEEKLNPEKSISFEPEINLPWPAYIPSSYIPHDRVRLMYYKHLLDIEDTQKLPSFEEELQDSFGPLPDEVKNLIGQVMILHLCRKLKIKDLKVLGSTLYLIFLEQNNKMKIPLKTDSSWAEVYDHLSQLKDRLL